MTSLEDKIDEINKTLDRCILTQKEVELSNECIRLNKIIKKKDEIINDNYNTMIKIRELIENDYFEDGSFENYNEVMSLLRGEDNE